MNKSANVGKPRIHWEHDGQGEKGNYSSYDKLDCQDGQGRPMQVEVVKEKDDDDIDWKLGAEVFDWLLKISGIMAKVIVPAHDAAAHYDVEGDGQIQRERVKQVGHHHVEVPHQHLEHLVPQQRQEDPRHAYRYEHYFTDEYWGALFGFVHRVDVVVRMVVVLQAVPTKLVATRARHVGASCCLLDGDLALRALVSQEEEVDEPDYCFETEAISIPKHSFTLGTFQVVPPSPLALLHGVDIVAGLWWAFLDIAGEWTIFFEEKLFELDLILGLQAIEGDADIDGLTPLKWRVDTTPSLVGDLHCDCLDMLIPAVVANVGRAEGGEVVEIVVAVADLALVSVVWGGGVLLIQANHLNYQTK